MKTALLVFSYVVGLGELLLAWYFWKTRFGDAIRKSMSFLALSTALWVLSTSLGAYATPSPMVEIIARLTYVFGIMLVTGLWVFSIFFPFPSIRLDRLHYVLLFTPVVIFSVALLFTETVIERYVSGLTTQGIWYGGPLYNIYNVYLLVLFFSALIILVRKLRRSDGMMLVNLKAVIWSIFLGGMPAVFVDLVTPLYKNAASTPLIGVVSTVIWLGVTTYIVVRK